MRCGSLIVTPSLGYNITLAHAKAAATISESGNLEEKQQLVGNNATECVTPIMGKSNAAHFTNVGKIDSDGSIHYFTLRLPPTSSDTSAATEAAIAAAVAAATAKAKADAAA